MLIADIQLEDILLFMCICAGFIIAYVLFNIKNILSGIIGAQNYEFIDVAKALIMTSDTIVIEIHN